MEEMKQKTAEALKSIKINELKTVLSSGKNIAIDIVHQVESTLKVKFKHIRINTVFNK